MAAEIGHFSLLLALVISFAGAVFPLAGAAFGNRPWMRLGSGVVFVLAVLLTISLVLLGLSFLTDDFSVLNVARNSNVHLAWYYKLAAVWGSHEGSILFWATVLSWWGAAVAFGVRNFSAEDRARIQGVLCAVAFGLVAFIIFTSNPFLRLFPPLPDGTDLNPLLQDPGMIFHPPLLYVGYVGFAVPFAFACAALMRGRFSQEWAARMLPWTIASWVFLTLGIGLGCYWSYYELGWGGWWGWDPVENASLLPWITATALLHCLLVVIVRSALKGWCVFLALLTFLLSLFGTFIVRSGVISSLHSFASDPGRGLFILIFLLLVGLVAVALFISRSRHIASPVRFAFFSKESFIVGGSTVLLAMMGVILLGTMYPFALESLGGAKISVGAPYFNQVVGYLAIPMVLLLAVAGGLSWMKSTPKAFRLSWGVSAVASAVLACAAAWGMGSWYEAAVIGCFLAFFIVVQIVWQTWERRKHAQPLTLSWMSMQLAHAGVACLIFGAVMSSCLSIEREVAMYPGDTTRMTPDISIRYDGWKEVRMSTYTAARGSLTLLDREKKEIARLTPEKRNYDSAMGVTMTEAAIDRAWNRDVYVSLGTQTKTGDGWVVRVYVKPFVSFLWTGILLMALGGVAAFAAAAVKRKVGVRHDEMVG